MDRFLIETTHQEQVCLEIIQLLNAQGYLWHFDWGCVGGVHTGWAVIEAENEAQARLAVPPLVRRQARVIKVTKFDTATFARVHGRELAIQGAGSL